MEFLVELVFSLFLEIVGYAPSTGKNRVKRFSPYFWLLVFCEVILVAVTFLFVTILKLIVTGGLSWSLANVLISLVLLAITIFGAYRLVYLTVSLITISFTKNSAD